MDGRNCKCCPMVMIGARSMEDADCCVDTAQGQGQRVDATIRILQLCGLVFSIDGATPQVLVVGIVYRHQSVSKCY